MTAPMTPERLAEIRAMDDVWTVYRARDELLAEIDRLRALVPAGRSPGPSMKIFILAGSKYEPPLVNTLPSGESRSDRASEPGLVNTPEDAASAILHALSNLGPLDDDALFVASGSRDDYREAIEDLLERGRVSHEVNEYLQQDIWSHV